MTDAERTARTYRHELWRAVASGIIETAGGTFLLLIAVRAFEAGALSKGLVAAGGNIGLLLSPWVVSWVTGARWAPSAAASRVLALGAAAFALAAAVPKLEVFVPCGMMGMAASFAVIPLLTQMYQDNYPAAERGRRFSRTLMLRIGTAALFGKLAGDALTGHLDYFPGLLLVFSLALAFASYCLAQCPTSPIVADGVGHPLRAMRFVKEDALFRRTLVCWMLMGFGNLMMVPLRVEYLANPRYDHAWSVSTIALLTSVIPNLARLVLSPVWGYLFDHINFFALRVTLNLGFAAGILTFFTSDSQAGLVWGAVLFGISIAGGDVAWSLWVTKFAPPARVADYMSVHTFLTGVRGVLAPIVAFACVSPRSLGVMAGISAALIVVATLLLLPELKWGRRARPAAALVEEVSD